MGGINSLIYRITGMMSTRQIMRTSENIGRELIQVARKTGDVDTVSLQKVITQTIGEKKAKDIVITQDKDDLFMLLEGSPLSKQMQKMMEESCKALVTKNPKNGKTILYLKQNLDIANKLNTITHECEHLLFKLTSIHANFVKFLNKIIPQSIIKKLTVRYAEPIQNLYAFMHCDAAEAGKFNLGDAVVTNGFSNCKLNINSILKRAEHTKDTLRTEILSSIDIICKNCSPKQKKGVIKSVRRLINDEVRAYKVGGTIEKEFCKNYEQTPNSHLFSKVLEEISKILKEQTRAIEKERLEDSIAQMYSK